MMRARRSYPSVLIFFAVLHVAGLSPAWASEDRTAICAAEARIPTPDNPVGKHWNEIEVERARDVCKAAFEADPESADIAANYGRAVLRSGDLPQALEILEQASKTSLQAQYSLGLAGL